jgi:hypothetical protein
MRAPNNSRKYSVLKGHEDDLVKHEQRAAYKQVAGAKDTAKFLEELARKTKKLVAKFMVRVPNRLPPL